MGQLQDKAIIITGATSGMGKATALRFAEEGARLLITGRNAERGKHLLAQLTAKGTQAFFYPGDIALPETNAMLVKKCEEHFGRIDALVLHAGMLGLGSVTGLEAKEWERVMRVNLDSAYHLFHVAIPVMLTTGGGVIVVNASIAAVKSFPGHAAYNASKAGLVALTKQVALDYGPRIRANCLAPGPVDTPLIYESAVAFPNPTEAVAEAGRKTPLQRLGTPEEIAEAALFLASDQSSWMTGSVLTVDGGATLT